MVVHERLKHDFSGKNCNYCVHCGAYAGESERHTECQNVYNHWTKEKPSIEGWYWCFERGDMVAVTIEKHSLTKRLVVRFHGLPNVSYVSEVNPNLLWKRMKDVPNPPSEAASR